MDPRQEPIQDYSSDEGDVETMPDEQVDIPNCEGIARRLWSTKVVTLQNAAGETVGKEFVTVWTPTSF